MCLQPLDLGELRFERPDFLLVIVGQISELDMLEQNAARIAEPPRVWRP
jgi:hypothetical protein